MSLDLRIKNLPLDLLVPLVGFLVSDVFFYLICLMFYLIPAYL